MPLFIEGGEVSIMAVVATTFIAVLTAELVGDKMVFTIASLTSRYRPLVVLAGLMPAQMMKMGVAVLAGGFIGRLPATVVAVASALTFGLTAVVLFRTRAPNEIDDPRTQAGNAGGARGVALAFSAVFFTEWGDPGQLAAAALAAHYGTRWIVWCAATAALFTKGLLAVTLGRGLRRHFPQAAMRLSAAAVCALMAVLSAFAIR
jgi:putative Ca2+/H+ antiporter (TMEM165/GDT1 family)